MTPTVVQTVQRLALSMTEAAEALGVSPDFFAAQIAPELAIVRKGRRKLVSLKELQRWLDANGSHALEDRG